MSVRLLAVGGEPACGKTTLFREFMKALPAAPRRKHGLVVFHTWVKERVVVLGDYTPAAGVFAGTDKLSMAVQKEALEFLRQVGGKDVGWTVLFEGDRLFNGSFLKEASAFCPVKVWLLRASPEKLYERHKQRGDKQTETWLAGRTTKVNNVVKAFPGEEWLHDTPEDTASLVAELRAFCGLEP
jgi:hypothetical protein